MKTLIFNEPQNLPIPYINRSRGTVTMSWHGLSNIQKIKIAWAILKGQAIKVYKHQEE